MDGEIAFVKIIFLDRDEWEEAAIISIFIQNT